jgi:hypothetical protein
MIIAALLDKYFPPFMEKKVYYLFKKHATGPDFEQINLLHTPLFYLRKLYFNNDLPSKLIFSMYSLPFFPFY